MAAVLVSFLVLCCQLTQSLTLHGIEINLHEESFLGRDLSDSTSPVDANVQLSTSGLIMVHRNFTCMLSNETDVDKKHFRRKSERGHRHKAERGHEFHKRVVDIIAKDSSVALLVIDKSTFVVHRDKYRRRMCDLVTPYIASFKFTPPGKFPCLVKVVKGTKLIDGKVAGEDVWQLDAPTKKWPSIHSIAESDQVLWIDEVRKFKMYSKTARVLHLGRPSLVYHGGGVLPDGSGIVVGCSDTGIDASHACFYSEGAIPPPEATSTACGSHPKICAINTAIPGLTDFRGTNGNHGTATASAIACYDTGMVVGMATAARLLIYDFTPALTDDEIHLPLVDKPGTRTYWEWAEEAVADAGMSVLSQSWGANTNGRYDSTAVQTDVLQYRNIRLSILSAAGNDAGDPEAPSFLPSSPCPSKSSLCIGAVSYVNPRLAASFSSFGPLPISGRIVPQLFSPGVGEVVAYGYHDPVAGHSHHVTMSGTSFSTPNIAGLVARYQQHYKARNQGQLPLAPLVSAVLMATSSRSVQAYYPGTSNAWAGLPVITEIGMEESGIFEQGPVPETAYCYSASTSISQNVSIVLAFIDYPSTVYSSVNLVNNLNMKVYHNYRLVFDGKDAVNPSERYITTRPIMTGDRIRVVVYESDLSFLGVIPYGLYLNSSRFVRTQNCGSCQSIDMDECGNEMNAFCNVTSGTMSSCLPSKNVALNDIHADACSAVKFQGVSLNGQCVPYICVDGYYYDPAHSMCRCIPGFRKSSTLICNEQETFIVASSDDLVEGSQQSVGVVSSNGSDLKVSNYIQYGIVLVATLLVIF